MVSTSHDSVAAAIWRNVFGNVSILQLVADMCHLASLVLLSKQITISRSCRGISLKTVQLYAIVFTCRYLDLFFVFVSWYNTVMKILFITVTLSVVYQMRFRPVVKDTYDKAKDTFPHSILIIAAAFLGCLPTGVPLPLSATRKGMEVLYRLSIYLEAVAIIPQLMLLIRTEDIESLTGNYVLLLGLYRALYVVKWALSWAVAAGPVQRHLLRRDWTKWLAGVVQTAIYVEFFYYYIRSWRRNEKLRVPTLCAMRDEEISELADLTCIGTAASPPAETGLRQRLLNTSTSEENLAVSEIEAVASSDDPGSFASPTAPLSVPMTQTIPPKLRADNQAAVPFLQDPQEHSRTPEGSVSQQSVLQQVEVTPEHSTAILSSGSTSPAAEPAGSE